MPSGLVIANAWETRLASGAPLHRLAPSRLRRVYPTMAVGILAGVTVALIAVAAGAAIVLVLAADPTLGIGFGDGPGTLLLGAPRVIATYTIGVLLHRHLRSAPAQPG